jgi:hypothetical protein
MSFATKYADRVERAAKAIEVLEVQRKQVFKDAFKTVEGIDRSIRRFKKQKFTAQNAFNREYAARSKKIRGLRDGYKPLMRGLLGESEC